MTVNNYQETRAVLEKIAGHANKGEIAAWSRKRKAIERLIDTHIRPLEDKILALNAELIPLYDQLTESRNALVEFCVHPIDMLEPKDGYIECKFCNAKLNVPVKVSTATVRQLTPAEADSYPAADE